MRDDKNATGKGERSSGAAPPPRASIRLPKPTRDQAEYLSKLQAENRKDYDKNTVVGGPRRRSA